MRFQKLLIVSATTLATTTLAGISSADDVKHESTKHESTKGDTSSTSTTTPGGSSTTITTPSAPTTSTTVTTQVQPGATQAQMPSASTTQTTQGSMPPTSTTTTTSAEDVSAAAPMPPMTGATTMPAPGETTTVYQRRRPNTPMLITGGALLVGTYATTAAIAAANGPVADNDLYIPVVGPWINIAERSNDRPDNTRDVVLIAGSGVLQGIGAAMTVASFFVPQSVPAARISAGNVKMRVTPTAGVAGGGIGAVGTF